MTAIKILILDDEYSKVEEICKFIEGKKGRCADIKHVTTVAQARKEMRASPFDLLIVDLNVPSSLGDAPTATGGADLLRFIRVDGDIKPPRYIMGITGREEIFDRAKSESIFLPWPICQYGSGHVGWQGTLLEILNYAEKLNHVVYAHEIQTDVVVITALRLPEFQAVLSLPCEWNQFRISQDPHIYYRGRIDGTDRKWSIVAASASRKGMPSSAALAMKMAMQFRPRFIVMLGICAGIESKTNPGDIIVADPTWDWGSGKYSRSEDGSILFDSAPHQVQLDISLRGQLFDIQAKGEVIRKIRSEWRGNVPSGALEMHIGPMASGASVLANKDVVLSIIEQHRELVGIEMEAYAVMSAAEGALSPPPKAMIIKSVCDFADAKKDDAWQDYASFTSASFFFNFFKEFEG